MTVILHVSVDLHLHHLRKPTRGCLSHPAQWLKSAFETLCPTNEDPVKLRPTNSIGVFPGSMQVADSQDFPPAVSSSISPAIPYWDFGSPVPYGIVGQDQVGKQHSHFVIDNKAQSPIFDFMIGGNLSSWLALTPFSDTSVSYRAECNRQPVAVHTPYQGPGQ